MVDISDLNIDIDIDMLHNNKDVILKFQNKIHKNNKVPQNMKHQPITFDQLK